MRAGYLFLSAFLASGCAGVGPHTGSADNEYRRENDRLEAVDNYQRLRERCRKIGGVIYVDRESAGRLPPAAMEMRNATCGRPIGSVQVW